MFTRSPLQLSLREPPKGHEGFQPLDLTFHQILGQVLETPDAGGDSWDTRMVAASKPVRRRLLPMPCYLRLPLPTAAVRASEPTSRMEVARWAALNFTAMCVPGVR
jgi:hypothetical protein